MKIEILNKISSKVLFILLAVAICLPLSVAHADPLSTFQTAEVHEFVGGADTTSGGTLTRKKNEVWARLALHGLEADAVYTVWWIIFNDPDSCAGGPGNCGGPDLGIAGGSVINAAGFVTSSSGTANITAHLEARRPPAGLWVAPPLGQKGLLPGNGHGAELHMVIQNHGPVVAGTVGVEISLPTGVDELGIGFPPVE